VTIADPATQIKGNDAYQMADPTTGAPSSQNVAIYGPVGAPSSNGAKSGAIGAPASSSTAGENGTGSFSGGTNCNSPPSCTGDAAVCGVARTQWSTTCQVHTDLAGSGPAPSGTSLGAGSGYNQNSLWVAPSPGGTAGDNANLGNYDATGFGIGTTCPLVDQPVALWGGQSFTIPLQRLCTPLSWLGYLVLAFAYYSAAKITMGGIG
jgi:hypothetical protein